MMASQRRSKPAPRKVKKAQRGLLGGLHFERSRGTIGGLALGGNIVNNEVSGFHWTGEGPVHPVLRALSTSPRPCNPRYRWNLFQLTSPSPSSEDAELDSGIAFSYRPRSAWVDRDRANRKEAYDVKSHPNDASIATDLASIPKLLWSTFAPYGRQLRPALLHDQLCDEIKSKLGPVKSADPPQRRAMDHQRRIADDLFYEALRNPGDDDPRASLTWFRARIFWMGVSLHRLLLYRPRLLCLMIVQIAISWILLGCILVGIANGDTPIILLVSWLALVLSGALWRPLGLAQAPIILTTIAAPVIPFLFLSVALSGITMAILSALELATRTVQCTVYKLLRRELPLRPGGIIVGPTMQDTTRQYIGH